MKKQLRILLIGPLTNIKANRIGGATISFGQLIRFMDQQQLPFEVINTQPFYAGWKKRLNGIFILASILIRLRKVNLIFLNSSRGGTLYLAPILYGIARVFSKKFVFRPFGGNLKQYLNASASWQQWLFKHTVLHSDLLFLQTQELVRHFSDLGANIAHLPTSRFPATFKDSVSQNHPFQYRFVFLGHVKQAKGIDLILEALTTLDAPYLFHIYGPIKDAKYEAIFAEQTGIYQGILPPEDLLPTLQKYDVLVLPTFYEGEGYPGAVIEAYSLGLPVISTQWKSIPELIRHRETGLLIPPRSVPALVEAIRFFNEENYREYSKNAFDHFQSNFNTTVVLKRALEMIHHLES